MNETTEILKVDEAGRVQTPKEKREWVLDEFERSAGHTILMGLIFGEHRVSG